MSKGGKQSTSVDVPKYQEDAAKGNIAIADQLAGLGYTPYYGPEVAAFTPMTNAAFEGSNQVASAFGMPTADYAMPQAQNFGGFDAYSSGWLYEQAIAQLKARDPQQYARIMGFQRDPFTGATSAPRMSTSAPAMPKQEQVLRNWFSNAMGG